jgi:hypothetical protein
MDLRVVGVIMKAELGDDISVIVWLLVMSGFIVPLFTMCYIASLTFGE